MSRKFGKKVIIVFMAIIGVLTSSSLVFAAEALPVNLTLRLFLQWAQ